MIIKGAAMTEPGHSGQLKIVGKVGNDVKGESPGFSVCAHPAGVAMHGGEWFVGVDADFGNAPVALLVVEPKFTSDAVPAANPNTELNRCWVPEVLGKTYDREGSFLGVVVAPVTLTEALAPDWYTDNHGLAKNTWATVFDQRGGPGKFKHDQLYLFWCERCGMTHANAVPIKNLGFEW